MPRGCEWTGKEKRALVEAARNARPLRCPIDGAEIDAHPVEGHRKRLRLASPECENEYQVELG